MRVANTEGITGSNLSRDEMTGSMELEMYEENHPEMINPTRRRPLISRSKILKTEVIPTGRVTASTMTRSLERENWREKGPSVTSVKDGVTVGTSVQAESALYTHQQHQREETVTRG